MTEREASGSCVRNQVIIIAVLGAAALLLAAARISPSSPGLSLLGVSLPGTCLWRVATGQACLTCGLTRALSFALHGNLPAATALHPSAIPVLAWGACQAGVRAGVVVLGLPCPRRDLDALVSSTSLALVIVIPRLFAGTALA